MGRNRAKKDLEMISKVERQLLDSNDHRFTTCRIIDGRRVPERGIPNSIELMPIDEGWVSKTRLTEFFTKQADLYGTLLEKVEKNIRMQESVLGALFD